MSQKIQKVTNVTKGIAGSHSILLLLFIFWLLVVTFLKFRIYKKNTTKHADKIKEYNTIFIVSFKKFVLFQRLCHLHHSLHCTYICFCVFFFVFFCLFSFLFFQVWMYHSKTLHPRWTWVNWMTLLTPPVVLIGNVFGFSVQQPDWFGDLIL